MISLPLPLGLIHLLVDAASNFVLFWVIASQDYGYSEALTLILLYNIVAFGYQFFVGYLADCFKAYKTAILISFLLLIGGVFLKSNYSVLAISMVALGNALFHIGGGVISIASSEKRAQAAGIFVAPGALGLVLGIIAGNNMYNVEWLIVVLTVIAFIYSYRISFKFTVDLKQNLLLNGENLPTQNTLRNIKKDVLFYLIFIILTVVALRSFIGFAMYFPWKTQSNMLLVLTFTIVTGKAVGGIIADRFGWMRTGVIALLISAPLITIFSETIPIALLGVFLFQFSMPVTLAAITSILPNRMGFAFGLACLALLAGGWPFISGIKTLSLNSSFIFIATVLSSFVLWIYFDQLKKKFNNRIVKQ